MLAEAGHDSGGARDELLFRALNHLLNAVRPSADQAPSLELLALHLHFGRSLTASLDAAFTAVEREFAGNDRLIKRVQTEQEQLSNTMKQVEAAAAKLTTLETKEVELCDLQNKLEKAGETLTNLEAEITQLESKVAERKRAIEGVAHGLDADTCLRVSNVGQRFGGAVEEFLQSGKGAHMLIGRIAESLRLHLSDDAQAVTALDRIARIDGQASIENEVMNGLVDLVSKIAEMLGDLDRRLAEVLKNLQPDAAY